MKYTTEVKNNLEIDFDIVPIVRHALEEDIRSGDVTTNRIVPATAKSRARWIAKGSGVIAGLFVGETVFKALADSIEWSPCVQEGESVSPGDVLVEIEGSSRALLTGERTALNFVQRISGIATKTRQYVNELEGTGTQILDTRKTVPGLRTLDKYAVKAGGGTNHRTGLYDMVLIKENHIRIAGGIAKAVEKVRREGSSIKIEIETTNLTEVEEALAAGADIIMLDNMSNDAMAQAVQIIAGNAKTEASGNVTLSRLKEIAACGVDYISSGALTHSVTAFDISQLIES